METNDTKYNIYDELDNLDNYEISSTDSNEYKEENNDIIDDDIVVIPNYVHVVQQEKIKIEYKKQSWRKKDNLYCNNCGKFGHIYKKCYEPITSYGIICLNLNNDNIYNFYISKYKFPNNTQQLKNICINKYIQKNISCNNRKDLDIYDNIIATTTETLLVRRMHTYNYIHLIRGIYELDLELIIRSINLLTKKEYTNLITKSFENLWYDIWKKNEYTIEYYKAEEQFNILKNYILPQIEYKLNVVYLEPEWGFPKGKRNNNETNLECAKREFEEETGLTSDKYEILDRLYPLIENITGSNDINYKHIYYIAILKPDITYKTETLRHDKTSHFTGTMNRGTAFSQPSVYYDQAINTNEINNNFEIGDIGLYNIENTLDILREYNVERKDILNKLRLFFTYNTRYYEKFYHDKN